MSRIDGAGIVSHGAASALTVEEVLDGYRCLASFSVKDADVTRGALCGPDFGTHMRVSLIMTRRTPAPRAGRDSICCTSRHRLMNPLITLASNIKDCCKKGGFYKIT